MNTFPVEYYDLLTRALGGNDNARLQGFLDDVIANKYNSLQLDGFSFADDMQLDFTYEQIQKEIGLNVMAQYYDLDSPAIPVGTEGAQLSTGKIPRMKGVEYWDEDKYRKMLIDEQRFGASSDRVVNAAIKGLFNTVDTLIGGHTNSLTYQRHQIVSTGKFTLTATNNPNGIKSLTFASHVPTANVKTLDGTKRWWTSVTDGVYSNPGTACDPIADLQAMVKTAKNKGVRGHFEVADTYMDQIIAHPKVVAAIAVRQYPLAPDTATAQSAIAYMSSSEKDAVLASIVGASFKRIDSLVSVEKWDSASKSLVRPTFEAFESNVIVFVPDGSLGEVKTVEPIAINGGTYGSFYGGRLLLTVGADYVKKCQSFNTEMTSLVVPDKPQYMWYLHPYKA